MAENGELKHQDEQGVGQISEICRHFLRHEYHAIDPRLEGWLQVLSDVGAAECWHKKSTFKAHLFETYKMCKIWGFSNILADTMLFHSAYSNSYVSMAVFKTSQDRPLLASLVGPRTEELIHLFCVVPRHDLIYEHLLKVLPDDGLVVPAEGVQVKHIHTGEPLRVGRPVVTAFLALTMVDFSEQLMSWQDQMFENTDGKLHFAGSTAHVLWPAAMKPGLYHAALSRMGRLLRNTLEAMQADEAAGVAGTVAQEGDDGAGAAWADLQLSLPAVYDHCTALVHEADEARARDLYWDVVVNRCEPHQAEEAEPLLREACVLNPHVAEPHVLLAQLLLQRDAYDEAKAEAAAGLDLLCIWGTAWDKRMAWDAWVAWARVLLRGADKQVWPVKDKPMGMLNLGLV